MPQPSRNDPFDSCVDMENTAFDFHPLSSEFRLLDVSKDNKFMAILGNDYYIYVYSINFPQLGTGNRKLEINKLLYSHELKTKNFDYDYSCIFLSVASETGYVALSYLKVDTEVAQEDDESDDESESIETQSQRSKDFSHQQCMLFKDDPEPKIIPFAGRAVFLGSDLVFINDRKVELYDTKLYRRKWHYSLQDIHRDIAEIVKIDPPVHLKVSWGHYTKNNENEGNKLINMTRNIRDEVFMTFYSGNVTKVWSLFDGSLITSLALEAGELVMAVSENKQLLATYNSRRKHVNIYDTQSLLLLHWYKPKYTKESKNTVTVTSVKFCRNHRCILITGTLSEGRLGQSFQKTPFFEVWQIEKERCLISMKQNELSSTGELLIITFGGQDDSTISGKLEPVSDTFKDFFMEYMTIGGFSSFQQTPVNLKDNKLWGYACIEQSNKIDMTKNLRSEVTATLECTKGFASYFIDDKYILRFGPRTVQLWKLKACEEEEKENTFQPDPENNEIKYHTSLDESTLLFIRAYKGTSSNLDDDWKIAKPKESSQSPRIKFMDDKGHIAVDIEHVNSSKIIVDEFFLPLPESQSDSTNHYDEIESTSQALYCLYKAIKKTKTGEGNNTFMNIINKTENLLENIINKIEKLLKNNTNKTEKSLENQPSENNINYFKTKAGNRTLAVLVSFKQGKKWFKKILIEKHFPMTIFSFPTPNEENENFLTLLIKQTDYDLFELLFNEIVYEYHMYGTNNLFPLVDALTTLRKEKIPKKLLKYTQRLSDIGIEKEKSGLIKSEYFKKNSRPHPANFTSIQHLKKYHSGWGWKLIYKAIRSHRSWNKKREEDDLVSIQDSFKNSQLCIIPLPGYNIYNVFSYGCSEEDDFSARTSPNGTKSEKKFHTLNVIEVLIDHKWHDSARDGLFGILLIHLVYYVFYTIGVSFPEEIFDYIPGTPVRSSVHLVCIVIMMITGTFLFFQETVQMKAWRWAYFKSIFNYVDIAAFVLPLATLILLIYDNRYLYEVSSITILVLWVHFFLRLRVLRTIGILSEIVLRLAIKFFPIIFTMIMVVIAFTHSFIVLLRRKEDAYFQEKYEGSITTNENNILSGTIVETSDQSQQNPFKDIFLAFTTVWFFTTGSFDPVFSGDVANSPMVLILTILFSFCTGLIVLNVVVALMTGAIESTSKKGNRNWYIHYIAVVAEIELFWGLFFKKKDPMYVYYWTNREDVDKSRSEIISDIKELCSRMGINSSRSIKY